MTAKTLKTFRGGAFLVLALAALAWPLAGPASAEEPFAGFGAQAAGAPPGAAVFAVAEPTDQAARAAFAQAARAGNCLIRFAPGLGTIALQSGLPALLAPHVTIEGNGVTLDGRALGEHQALLFLGTNDVIVSNLRLRHAPVNLALGNSQYAGLVFDVVLSHVTSQGAADAGLAITRGAHDLTVQYCYFAGCTRSLLIKYDCDRISIHHCLFEKQWIRGPLVSGGLADVRNIAVRNWGLWGTRFEDNARGNVVDCLFVQPGGPGEGSSALLLEGAGEVYLEGNEGRGLAQPATRGTCQTPLTAPPVTTHPVAELEALLLARAGARPWDDLDKTYYAIAEFPLSETAPFRPAPDAALAAALIVSEPLLAEGFPPGPAASPVALASPAPSPSPSPPPPPPPPPSPTPVVYDPTPPPPTPEPIRPIRPVRVNRPPTIHEVPDQEVVVGDTLRLRLQARDPDNDRLTFAIVGETPAGATLSTSGLFTYTPRAVPRPPEEPHRKGQKQREPEPENRATIEVVFAASDPEGASAETTARITVRRNEPPAFAGDYPDQRVSPGETLRVPIRVEDPEGGNVSLAMAGAPTGSLLSRGDVFQYAPRAATSEKTYTVRFTARDADGGEAAMSFRITVVPRREPTPEATPPERPSPSASPSAEPSPSPPVKKRRR